MSAPDRNEITSLLAAHANHTLTGAELDRLRSFAADDPELAREIEEVEHIHERFADERDLMARVAVPADPSEEASEEFQRLQHAAARASETLRSKLEHGETSVRAFAMGGARRASWWWLVAAALLVGGLWFALAGDRRPALDPDRPNDRTLGGTLSSIVLTAELSARQPRFSWLADPRARTYDVVLETEAGERLVARGDEFAIDTVWALTQEEFDRVARHDGRVILRIEGKDGAGHTVATSGDRPVAIR